MKARVLALALLSGALGLFGSCTRSDLVGLPPPGKRPIDNKLTVAGSFCTEDPLAVEFPVKILFVVDTSQSMDVTDPPDPLQNGESARMHSVLEVIRAYAGVPGVELGIITFNGTVGDTTQGFRRNVETEEVAWLMAVAADLNFAGGKTDYEAALDLAYQTILTDTKQADEKLRARSKYVVIFLSDGMPDPYVPADDLMRQVKKIHDLERERRLAELRLHTVYLSGRTPAWLQREPEALLREMARVGAGTFRHIANGEKLDFLDVDFTSFRRLFTLKRFMASNINALPIRDVQLAVDSDGDGLSDVEEELIGTDPTLRDTDGDGFSDFLEHRLRNAGFDPLDPSDADCAVTEDDDYNRRDDDGDGLLNCEERFLGTNPRLFDTDADGIPDWIEVRAGTSPVSDDLLADLDRDGRTNGDEVRDHTDPNRPDNEDAAFLRYRYDLRRREIRDSRVCYDFSVSNISLVPTLALPGAERGWNEIHLVLAQSPADAPHDYGEFRMACVRVRYLLPEDVKIPASGRVELQEEDFKRAGVVGDDSRFDPSRDCVTP
ncbi:vWA domain-containing protein [Vulgatibacter incomptus]|uniref:Calcium-binding acidic-repeat protein n=1 Tax=Vulgatibacter incomptus TaxID=1391653 RepID=A0A0K1PF19_9BACT|nr:vWA domain-containing protein [Vulgatibacter incomptus]AKU92115.1 Calcium-binding acidic-repeat protein precursor [Vulgatibacter incomptus]